MAIVINLENVNVIVVGLVLTVYSVPDCPNECQNVLVMYLITVSVMMDGVE